MSSTEKISNSEAQLRLMLTRLVLTAGADLLPAAAVLVCSAPLMNAISDDADAVGDCYVT
jgi:hypothetical protein